MKNETPYRLRSVSVVVTAEFHNPSVLNRDFLVSKGNVPEDWLEYFGVSELGGSVESVRRAFRNKDYQVRPNARFAVLNVGAARSAIRDHA